jgi:hypothetical protein
MALGLKFGCRLDATTPDLALRIKAALICFRRVNSVQTNFECARVNRVGVHNPRHHKTWVGPRRSDAICADENSGETAQHIEQQTHGKAPKLAPSADWRAIRQFASRLLSLLCSRGPTRGDHVAACDRFRPYTAAQSHPVMIEARAAARVQTRRDGSKGARLLRAAPPRHPAPPDQKPAFEATTSMNPQA